MCSGYSRVFCLASRTVSSPQVTPLSGGCFSASSTYSFAHLNFFLKKNTYLFTYWHREKERDRESKILHPLFTLHMTTTELRPGYRQESGIQSISPIWVAQIFEPLPAASQAIHWETGLETEARFNPKHPNMRYRCLKQ